MKYRLLNLMADISLAVLLTMCGSLLLAYTVDGYYHVVRQGSSSMCSVYFGPSREMKLFLTIEPGEHSGRHFISYKSNSGAEDYPNRIMPGIWWKRTPERNGTHFITLGISTYLLLSITGIFPLMRLVRWVFDLRSAYLRRHGLCAVCGYDMRETPNRCPECGMAASPLAF